MKTRPSTEAPVERLSLGTAFVNGFLVAVILWTAWFITHLPWWRIDEPVKAAVLLGIWVVAGAALYVAKRRKTSWATSAVTGLITAATGLLLLASARDATHLHSATPLAAIPGFLVLGAVAGILSKLAISNFKFPCSNSPDTHTLSHFAIVAAIAAMPLLFIGGLVTTRNVGLAVPDWPNTYGMNMFLYPLGNASEGVFLEHSHRLFGTLVGLTTLVLMIWTLAVEPRKKVRLAAVGVFAAVVAQGVLGGAGRVLLKSVPLALVHGILAQLVFAALVSLAVILWARPEIIAVTPPMANARRAKALATAAMHSTILQVMLGAAYRHFRDQHGATHALWAHIGFSFVVLVSGLLGGFVAYSTPAFPDNPAAAPLRALRRLGLGMVIVVILQFTLGWATLILGGTSREPDSIAQALLRTAHQFDGALLLGLTTATAVLATRLYRRSKVGHDVAPAQ